MPRDPALAGMANRENRDNRADGVQRQVPALYVVTLALAYVGSTVALFTPLQNVLPRLVESATSPADKALNLGLVIGLGALAAMISNPVSGSISDRRVSLDNRSVMVLIGLASGCCSLVFLGAQRSVVGIVIWWTLCQLTINIAYSSMAASVVDQVSQARWGVVWGVVGVAQAVGLIGGFAVVTLLLPGPTSGLQGLAVIYAVCLAPLVLVLRWLPRGRRDSAAHRPRSIWLLARSEAFGRVWAGKFLVILANGIAVTYLYYYLQDVIHLRAPGHGQLILVLISTIAAAGTSVAAGWLADRSGRYRRYAVIGTALMALVGFELSAIGTWPLAIVGAFVLGGGYGIFISMSQALSTRVLPDPGSAGRDLGVINIASALPQVIGPPLAALIISVGAGYRGVFAFAGVLLLVAAAVFSRVQSVARDG